MPDHALQRAHAQLLPHGLPPTALLIGGRRVDGERVFTVHDRYLQLPLAEVASATRAQVAEAVATARASLSQVPPPYARAKILSKVAQLLDQRRQQVIDVMVAEVGFPPADANGELERALDTVQLCAEEAKRLTGEMIPLDGNPGQHNRIGFTLRAPVGVVCAITPFNAPLNSVLHKIAPALAAGNAVVLKPSDYTPLTASLVCELFLEAGLPPSSIALLNGGAQVGAWLLEEQGIDFYTFTGSTKVGRIIQAAAGLRRTQLELGSIACTVVCADADLDHAIPRIARASFRKAGQVCTSIQRLYVARDIEDDVKARLMRAAAEMPAGDPRDPAIRIGPMISERDAMRAQSWLAEAAQAAARIECGGTREGAVLQPAVLSNVKAGLKVIEEEVFAPVVSLLPFDRIDEAIDSINALRFGLATGVFTRNLDDALRAARAIRSGAVHINETSSSRVDGMPYGGVKDSGFGREGPRWAMREMTEERMITLMGS